MREALITGGAGFIGSHLADRLLADGWRVTVVDNFDPFYDPAVKRANVAPHLGNPHYRLVEADIRDAAALDTLLGAWPADPVGAVIVHLAAKAGVRPSIADPVAYGQVNVGGTQNLLELARARGVAQFVFGSSSSVYGVNPRVPWREDDAGLLPISPYAATKVAGELLGHVYSHLHGVRFVALRFFTVYGPRQRPDLAIHKFARLMRAGRPVPLFGDGSTSRDYTYVDDIVAGVRAAMDWRDGPYAVINLGNSHTVTLAELVAALESALGAKAQIERLPEQPGDVPRTWADVSQAAVLLNWLPTTPFTDGLCNFVEWLDAQ